MTDDLRPYVEEVHRAVEPHIRPPAFSTIRTRYRRRRQRRAVAATSGALCLVAVTAVVVTRDTAPVAEPDTVTFADFVPGSGEYRARDTAFVDAARGWALGARCGGEDCAMTVSRTVDGGLTWAAPTPLGEPVGKVELSTGGDPASGAARSLRFADARHGYAFNPALYATADAGTTWRPVSVPGQVTGVAVAEDVWVTTRECPRDDRLDCPVEVLAGRLGSTDLDPLPEQPPVVGRLAVVRRTDAATAWVLSYGERNRQHLVRTTDGGAAWTELDPPCEEFDVQHLSATPGSVWVVCSVQEGTSDSAKTVYVSEDGGDTWDRRGTPPDTGITNDIDAVSPTTAYLSASRGDLLVTRDGGRNWTSAVEGDGFINLEFLDGDTGWFFGPKGAMWRLDGTTARPLPGPVS